MNYFNRLINYFATSYSNNDKFHHSSFGFLKIFFERNNKVRNTNTVLGTVFRNSKWSDLKVQNIKTSLTTSWTKRFFLTMFILTLISAFGHATGTSILSRIPFVGEALEAVNYVLTHLYGMTRTGLFSLAAIVASTLNQNLNRHGLNQEYIRNSLNTDSRNPQNAAKGRMPVKLTTPKVQPISSLQISKTYETARDLMGSSSCLVDMSPYVDFDFPSHTSTSGLQLSINPYGYNNLELLSPNLLNITNNNLSYINLKGESNGRPIKSNVTPDLLRSLEDVFRPATFNALNAETFVKLGKQDRWFLKNSLLAENTIINSNSFTQSKRLLGSNALSESLSNKNVWASSKVSNISALKELKSLSALQRTFYKTSPSLNQTITQGFINPDVTNFEHFETSRMWLVKKYFLTHQTKNNTITVTDNKPNGSVLINTQQTTSPSVEWLNAVPQNVTINLCHFSLKNVKYVAAGVDHYSQTRDVYGVNTPNFDLLSPYTEDFLLKLSSSSSSTSSEFLYYSLIGYTNTNALRPSFTFRKH